jgi:hypothetical protein
MPVPLPAPRSAVSDAYARVTKAYPGLTVTELTPEQQAPQGDGWVTADTPGRDRQLRPAPLRVARLPADHDPLVPPARELELLLPGSTKPYVGSAAFRELTGPNGESLPTRDRASCCMFYTLDPEDTCATCPRTLDPDRITKLTAAAAS